jgi:hypothetical protein
MKLAKKGAVNVEYLEEIDVPIPKLYLPRVTKKATANTNTITKTKNSASFKSLFFDVNILKEK